MGVGAVVGVDVGVSGVGLGVGFTFPSLGKAQDWRVSRIRITGRSRCIDGWEYFLFFFTVRLQLIIYLLNIIIQDARIAFFYSY